MVNKEVIDCYNETSVDSVNIPEEYYRSKHEIKDKSYQKLSEILSLGNIEFFTITVLIGKFIVEDDEYENLPEVKSNPFFKLNDYAKSKDEMHILEAFAVQEVDNIYILKDYVAMRDIWQKYSCRGFEKIYEWYSDNNINLEVKLAEELQKTFTNNGEVSLELEE